MSQINFELEQTGSEAVAAAIDDVAASMLRSGTEGKRLSDELKKLKPAGDRGTEGLDKMRRASDVLTHSAQGLAAKVDIVEGKMEAFGSALGALGSEMQGLGPAADFAGQALGSLSAGIGTATSMPGPFGLALGGLTAAMGIASAATQAFETETVDMAARIRRDAIPAVDELATAMSGMERQATLRAGLGAAASDIEAEIERLQLAQRGFVRAQAEARREYAADFGYTGRSVDEQAANLSAVNEQVVAFRAAGNSIRDVQREIDTLRIGLQTARREESRLASEAAEETEREAEGLRRRTAAQQREADRLARGSGSSGGPDELAAAYARVEAAMASGREMQARAQQQLADDAVAQKAREVAAEVAKTEAHKQELRKRDEAELAHASKVRDAEQEAFEEAKQLLEKQEQIARETFQKTKDEAEGVLGPAIDGLTGALSAVIAGSESADEAFQGLLASFLEMLSQKAALEAAGQFASAIASFASQDYGGGALHLAAGAAWTAVAVASGAASIAVAPPAAATPASPRQSAPADRGGGGTTIVNLNGAMVTASTHADIGREVSRTLVADQRRHGRAG